jgi:hypothetical protein
MHPKQVEYTRRYRERKREKDREAHNIAQLSINIPKAVRFAASRGHQLAKGLLADTDEKILRNVEEMFYEAAMRSATESISRAAHLTTR